MPSSPPQANAPSADPPEALRDSAFADEALRLQVIEKHIPLVDRIARKLMRTMAPNVELGDLVQDGMLGLMDALIRSSVAMTAHHLESHVALRVRGAMVDGLRARDPASRQLRRTLRESEAAIQRLSHRLGRNPSEREVAEALDLPLATYLDVLRDAHEYRLISLEDLIDQGDPEGHLASCISSDSDPLAVLEREAFLTTLAQALAALPARQREVMDLYYREQLSMREAGARMGLTESRVSQLHTLAIAQLRGAVHGHEAQPGLLQPRKRPRQRRQDEQRVGQDS